MYGDAYEVAPLSVLVDPVRALRALGVEPGRSFTSKVLYVYRKQLEEAAFIVINKVDAIEPARVAALRAGAGARSSRRRASSRCRRAPAPGSTPGSRRSLPPTARSTRRMPTSTSTTTIYGEGEALLGWLNATATPRAAPTFDGNALAAGRSPPDCRRVLEAEGIEIAHLKMTLAPDDGKRSRRAQPGRNERERGAVARARPTLSPAAS